MELSFLPNSSSTPLPPGTSLLACMAAILWELFFWLCWVFVAAWAFMELRCMGFSLQWFLLLQSKGSRHGSSGVEAPGL